MADLADWATVANSGCNTSHATNIVEHPELVAQRMVRLARIIGRDNLMAGTDCGFAQATEVRGVHP